MAYIDKSFQERMSITCEEIFAEDHFNIDRRTRSILEEALEVAQVIGFPKERAHQLIDYVYDRPVGELRQEIGGLLSTLAAFATINNIDLMEAGEDELDRLNANKEKIALKHKNKTII